MTEFWIGVAAGLFTALLIYVIREFVWPGLSMRLFNSEPNINGRWLTYDDEAAAAVGTAEITQRGRRLKIKVARHTSRSGKSIDRKFTYSGEIASGMLTATFHDDSAKYQSGTIVLDFVQNPDRLKGLTVYKDTDVGPTVISKPFMMKRH